MSLSALSRAASYAGNTLRYRHFWTHLAFSDLRARFRRSRLGILWLALQPLLLTIIMSGVFIFVFSQRFSDYSVYLFSGLIVWEFVTGCFVIGGMSYIAAEGYVRQVRLPMIIYPLKSALYCCIVFMLAFSGFTLYALAVKPQIVSLHWLYILPFFLTLAVFGTPLAILSAIVNIRFRDFQQGITLFLQMLLYVSPVMMLPSVFEHRGLREWNSINPVSALLELFRAPLLEGTAPALSSYLLVLAWALLFWLLALALLARNERKIVFYY